MRYLHVLFILALLSVPFSLTHAADKEGFALKKQTELQQIKPKKPVRIKLKRTAKDEYSWELSGDDVEEIIKTDKRLRNALNRK